MPDTAHVEPINSNVATFRAWLATGPHAIDGGLATELERAGHNLNGILWSARLLRDDPDAIRRVHLAYFAAGAKIATSASYQASRTGFAQAGLDPNLADELLRTSVHLAREARDQTIAAGASGPLWVAASIGPYGAVLGGGEEYVGHYNINKDELIEFHAERIEVLVSAEPDLLAIETIPDLVEVAALADVLGDYPHLPIWLSLSCRDGFHTNAGDRVTGALEVIGKVPNLVAVGVNCTAPEYVSDLLTSLRVAKVAADRPDIALLAYPNSGRVWDGATEQWHGEGWDHLPEAVVSDWCAIGAELIGGCCGLGPTAIEHLAATLS